MHIQNHEGSVQKTNAENVNANTSSPLSSLDALVDAIQANLPNVNPFNNKNSNLDEKTIKRLEGFKSNQGSSFLEQLTDEQISTLTIETLLFLAGVAISLDIQELQRVSEETIKFTKRLEEKRMKEAEEAYTNWSMIASAVGTAGSAVGGVGIMGMAGYYDFEGVTLPVANDYARALGAGKPIFDNMNNQQIDSTRMMKQLVSSLKQEQTEELRQLSREIEKLDQMIERATSLRLQAFRN